VRCSGPGRMASFESVGGGGVQYALT
jgi:hypothetical protein